MAALHSLFRNFRARHQRSLLLWLSGCASLLTGGHAQPIAAHPGYASGSEHLLQVLRALVQRADVIFAGQVTVIERGQSPRGWAAVSFRVETAIRGVAAGDFTAQFPEELPGSLPLAPGERYVLFLREPNLAGISSTVQGPCGMLRRTGGDWVDLRRLQYCIAPVSFSLEHDRAGAEFQPPLVRPQPLPARPPPQAGETGMALDRLLPLLGVLARETSGPAVPGAPWPISRPSPGENLAP